MIVVSLAREADFETWRTEARALLERRVAPDAVNWRTPGMADDLFADSASPSMPADDAAPPADAPRVPRAFVDTARVVACHVDADRYNLLYRLLWRLSSERGLWDNSVDDDVHRANAMAREVRRDRHKMTAFVRFREVVTDDGAFYVAWFEPTHHIVELTAPFFVERFASMRWSILTPRESAHWDGETLRFDAGHSRADAPDEDALENVWRTYYASIFNPARLKTAAMRREMPKKYWSNLPEAELIDELVKGASTRESRMVSEPPAERSPRAAAILKRQAPAAPVEVAEGGWEAVRDEAAGCQRCPLFKNATQTVFGEGSPEARLVFVGEQPGDSEDLTGRPFVGPAGQLFDRALAEAGIARADAYVTNAVKHFKYEPRGKRRIHQKPTAGEIDICRWWIDQELAIVRPKLAVALGATAVRGLTGKTMPVMATRGKVIAGVHVEKVFVTVHPSFLLRLPDEDAKAREYRAFVRDLEAVKALMEAG